MRPTFHRITRLLIGTSLAISMAGVPVVAQEAPDALDFGTGTAVLQLGDERYEFDMGSLEVGGEVMVGVCRGIFGMIQGVGHVTDGRAISIEMDIPPVDWEAKPEYGFDPPNITFQDDNNDVELVAGKQLAEMLGVETESQSTVTENDGYNAAGTATFVDSRALMMGEPSEPIEATFEVHCDQEE